MKISALLIVLALALSASASFSPSSFEVRSALNQKMKERWNLVETNAIKESQSDVAVRMSACDAADPLNDDPCACAARDSGNCIWIIGIVVTGGSSTTSTGGSPTSGTGFTSSTGASGGGSTIQASVEGKCVEGGVVTGPSNILELNLFETCWWPSEEHACDEICTWRMAIEIPGFPIYFRAELKISNTFRVRNQADAQNMFSSISFVAFMMYAAPDASALGIPTSAGFPGFPIFTGTAMLLAAPGEGGLGGGSSSSSSGSATGAPSTGGGASTAGASGSASGASASASSNNDGFPGVRGAATFLMMDSYYTYDLAAFPNGYDGSDPASVTVTPLAVSGFAGTPSTKPKDANGIEYNVWTMTASVQSGGQVQYKCVFSEFPFVYNSKTLSPYDAKCDLISSGLNIPAGQGFGVRMLVAAAAGEYNAATNTASSSITIGASALVFAPVANTTTGTVDVKLSAVSTCNSDVEDESFFTQEAFTSTLDENMGPGYDVLCTYASFASNEASWNWDPETKVDRTKAEGNIAAKSSPAATLSTSPVALLIAALLATLIALIA